MAMARWATLGVKSDLLRDYALLAEKDDLRRCRTQRDDGFPGSMVQIGALLADEAGRTLSSEPQPQSIAKIAGASTFHLEAGLAQAWLSEENKLRAKDEVKKAWTLCESPIERCLVPWLVLQDFMAFPYPNRVLAYESDGDVQEGELCIQPQAKIPPYRIDFLITAKRKDGKIRHLAVECDGAEYHDNNSDIRRDRALAQIGIPTLRASGSEIVHHPSKVAIRAARYFCDWGFGG
jgi:hypothetical protein